MLNVLPRLQLAACLRVLEQLQELRPGDRCSAAGLSGAGFPPRDGGVRDPTHLAHLGLREAGSPPKREATAGTSRLTSLSDE